MWREFIQTLAADTEYEYEFAPPATYFQLERLEQVFKASLPDALRKLLLETNGVRQIMHYKEERVPIGQVLWDTESIQRHNRKMRTNNAYRDFYLPFDDLLFFASPGADKLRFALRIDADCVTETVIAWLPTNDTRTEQATSLRDFIKSWFSGQLGLGGG